MEQLFELSRSTLLMNLHQLQAATVQLIQRIFKAEAVAIFNAESERPTFPGMGRGRTRTGKECYLRR